MKTIYETDFYGWSEQQADLLKKGEYKKVDWDNVIEEIESLGRSEKRTLISFLKVYLIHRLKKKYQPDKNYGRSWDNSIRNSHEDFLEVLNENPSLKSKLNEILQIAYRKSRVKAAEETGLEEDIFDEKCPWTIEEVLK